MLDLDGAGRRLAVFRAGTATPLPAIERGARRRQRRRRFVSGGAGGVVAAALVVAGLQLIPAHDSESVAVRAPATTVPVTHAPTDPPAVAVPEGWFVHELGLLSFATPDWASGATRSEYTTGPCRHRRTCTTIPDLIARAAGPTTGMTRTAINGLAVWESTRGKVHIYDIPATGVEVFLRGRGARGIARTLQPSAIADILSAPYPITVPADWKTVGNDGVTLRVPPSWSIRHPSRNNRPAYGTDGCSVPSGSTIYLGSFSADCSIEEANYPTGPWLWLGQETGRYTGPTKFAFDGTPVQNAVVRTGTAGVRITYSMPALGPPTLTIQTSARTLHAHLGFGSTRADVNTEEEVLTSIRLDHPGS